jgi:nitrite reductase/ring-hydroxylating ferredoxin subunit
MITAAAGIGVAACAADPAPRAGAPAPPPTATPPPATPAPAATPPPAGRLVACTTADIPVGGGRVFTDARVTITQPTRGDFRGFGVVCTHDGCLLDSVSDGTINCPCHGSRYAITDGSVVRGPARTGLRTERVAIEDGCVVVLRRAVPGSPVEVPPTGPPR